MTIYFHKEREHKGKKNGFELNEPKCHALSSSVNHREAGLAILVAQQKYVQFPELT